MHLVGPALGDGVHQAAHEPALPHVEGRDLNLELLYRLDRNGPLVHRAAGDSGGGAECEEVVVDGTVDLDVVEPVILTTHRPAVGAGGDLGRRRDEIRKGPVQGRQTVDHGVGQ